LLKSSDTVPLHGRYIIKKGKYISHLGYLSVKNHITKYYFGGPGGGGYLYWTILALGVLLPVANLEIDTYLV